MSICLPVSKAFLCLRSKWTEFFWASILCLMELQNATVLITGATGYIGGRLRERLVTEEKVHVRALVRTPQKGQWLAELGCEIVQGDIIAPKTVQGRAAGCQVIFHAAAWVSERGSKAEIWKVNVEGTQHVVDAARRRCATAGAAQLMCGLWLAPNVQYR